MNHPVDRTQMRKHFLATMKGLLNIQDTRGIELFGELHRAVHLSEMLDNRLSEELDLSTPRFRLLLHLIMVEEAGNLQGQTPTEISKWQRVSKNTISALLRGLEEQGLVERSLDPNDLRVFRIRLTEAGREMVLKTAPQRIEGLNQMLQGFSDQEIEQLNGLLEKLIRSIHDQLIVPECEAPNP